MPLPHSLSVSSSRNPPTRKVGFPIVNRDTVLRLGHRRLGFPPPQPPSSSSASSNSTLTPLSSLSLSASNPHGSSPVFSNNMGKKSEPVITKCKESENWTKVTFKPDLAKFNMTHLEDDVVALMKKRVIDLAGYLGKTVKVELNGQRIPIKSFLDYVNLYLQSASKARLDALPGFSFQYLLIHFTSHNFNQNI
ncbi:unnamed protein product [Camellia sinensis]